MRPGAVLIAPAGIAHEAPPPRAAAPGSGSTRSRVQALHRPSVDVAHGLGGPGLRRADPRGRAHRDGLGRRGGAARDPRGGRPYPRRERGDLRHLRDAEGGRGGGRGGPVGAPRRAWRTRSWRRCIRRSRTPGDRRLEPERQPRGPSRSSTSCRSSPSARRPATSPSAPRAGEGAIVFEDGFVVASFTWDSPPLDPRAAQLPPEKRAALLRTRIEMALEQLIRLREGQFSFNLTDEPPQRRRRARHLRGDARAGPQRAGAAARPGPRHGRGPARLDGRPRGLLRRARGAGAAVRSGRPSRPGPPARPPPTCRPPSAPSRRPSRRAGAPPAPPRRRVRTILLVDDEDDVRRILAEHFTRGGLRRGGGRATPTAR